jgi:demethylmenaquinone methyltransferase/2-methoxy-6-polyprenyl-1,4-benzoquinol methylase
MPFNHFDFLAPYYDRFMKPVDPTRLSKQLGLPISGLLLDAAGGTGGKSYPLLGMVSAIVVADSSKGMLGEAVMKSGLKPVRSETEYLPFMSGSFDRIIMVDALHHVSDYRMTAKELWRVLKPGGRIVIEEPDIRTFPVKIMAGIEKLAMMRSHFKSPQQIAEVFTYLNATTQIEVENSTAWVRINKSTTEKPP